MSSSVLNRRDQENLPETYSHSVDCLMLFLREIGFIPLLSEAEEQQLAVQAASGDLDARNRLVEANLRLAVSIAKTYQTPGIPLQDLIQEGSIGLMRAAEKFDVSKGYRFTTYATWWVRQTITRAISETGRIIRLPTNQVEKLAKLKRLQRNMEQEFGNLPTTTELAEGMRCSEKKVKDLLTIFSDAISLDTPIGDEEDTTLGSFVETKTDTQPEELAIVQLMQEDVNNALNILKPREAAILRLRYGIGCDHNYTLDEVGAVMGLTRERIRQIEKASIDKLRRSSYTGTLMAYVS